MDASLEQSSILKSLTASVPSPPYHRRCLKGVKLRRIVAGAPK
jgi:hypothetical protein